MTAALTGSLKPGKSRCHKCLHLEAVKPLVRAHHLPLVSIKIIRFCFCGLQRTLLVQARAWCLVDLHQSSFLALAGTLDVSGCLSHSANPRRRWTCFQLHPQDAYVQQFKQLHLTLDSNGTAYKESRFRSNALIVAKISSCLPLTHHLLATNKVQVRRNRHRCEIVQATAGDVECQQRPCTHPRQHVTKHPCTGCEPS